MTVSAPSTLSNGDAPDTFAELFSAITDNIEHVIQGKREVVELTLLCMLAEGHLLLEDVPIRPLHARAAKSNVASVRVLQRCGFAVISYRMSLQANMFTATIASTRRSTSNTSAHGRPGSACHGVRQRPAS